MNERFGANRLPLARWLDEYGMLAVLGMVVVGLSVATVRPHETSGREAGIRLGESLSRKASRGGLVVIAGSGQLEKQFVEGFRDACARSGHKVPGIAGDPADARKLLESIAALPQSPEAIACSKTAADWIVIRDRASLFPSLSMVPLVIPEEGSWPAFLTRDNLLNIGNQIAVISILAIGMTVVVATGGIDLSVGSLVALSGVLAADFIRGHGGSEATTAAMVAGASLGIAAATISGMASGVVVTALGVPPFLATLATMLVVRGTALEWTGGESIAALPGSFVWLGRGTMGPIPVAMALMAGLYALFHFIMTRSVAGRHWLAIGGNTMVARLAGIPIGSMVTMAYGVSGFLAGLGGIVLASQLRNASPTYGDGYELTVIAAVVVGGASLSGGRAGMLGTLTGAFLIATIQNGMNLLGISPFVQKIVLGSVILGAVVIDRWRQALLARINH